MEKPTKTPPKASKVFSREIGAGFFGSIKLFLKSKKGVSALGLLVISLFVGGVIFYSLYSNNSGNLTVQTGTIVPERDRIAKETKDLEAYASELKKTEVPTAADPEARFAYYNTLINSALASNDCNKAIAELETYGLNQDLQKFSSVTLEPLGNCYLLANNKPKAKIVFTANLAKMTNAKASGQVAAKDVAALDALIVKAQRLLGSTK